MKKKTGKTRFTLDRSGSFTVRTSGASHCGTKEVLTIQYRFVCVCSADSIDERGFLFDQMRVQVYFDRIKFTSLSCELFAIQAARDLFRQVKEENGKCMILSMALMLSPEPYLAKLTFEWEA